MHTPRVFFKAGALSFCHFLQILGSSEQCTHKSGQLHRLKRMSENIGPRLHSLRNQAGSHCSHEKLVLNRPGLNGISMVLKKNKLLSKSGTKKNSLELWRRNLHAFSYSNTYQMMRKPLLRNKIKNAEKVSKSIIQVNLPLKY